ncbi:MAG: hypothetical protein FWH17_10535 [Oscillospiraceae bacterium]|nr:hypothetical protein [Oscillospiraceae bacterium]
MKPYDIYSMSRDIIAASGSPKPATGNGRGLSGITISVSGKGMYRDEKGYILQTVRQDDYFCENGSR